jgi:glutamyl-Q tRNA(Asp) synthetase
MSIVTRFAPSPTGFLHLGHGYSAFLNFSRAQAGGGHFLLRLEDIDAGRCRAEYAAAVLEDLAWLGLRWDGEVRVQSSHLGDYQMALDKLAARGLLYPCFCTRAEIARALAAPHGGEAVYPGTCRAISPALRAEYLARGSPYALRLDVRVAMREAQNLRFFDEAQGWVAAAPDRFGDVVLARKDVPASYHFCVVHDDAAQQVTHVIRGEDLRAATHLHVLLQHLLGVPTPVYAFHPLLTDAAGTRLAKRDKALSLRHMRSAGVRAENLLREYQAP